MPIDIRRYISDLVPFEFARRGIHVTVRELPERRMERSDVNLSKIYLSLHDNFDEVLFQTSCIKSVNEPARVTGVYKLGVNQTSPFRFQHDGHPYELSWFVREEDENDLRVKLSQLDAGCCYDGREKIERFFFVPRGDTDLVAEFRDGNMVYSPEKHGDSILEDHDLLLHGWSYIFNGVIGQELQDTYLLVIVSESLPFCSHYCELADREVVDIKSGVWRFELEESPEWALHSDGQPPLP